jgi:hypothetical protein
MKIQGQIFTFALLGRNCCPVNESPSSQPVSSHDIYKDTDSRRTRGRPREVLGGISSELKSEEPFISQPLVPPALHAGN